MGNYLNEIDYWPADADEGERWVAPKTDYLPQVPVIKG